MMFYFIKSRENQISDEMQKKINALAMVMSFWVMLLVDVIAYMVHTWWRTLPLSITQVLGLFLFGNILLMCIFQWRYRTHTENLPF
jgi:membrane protein YdbS with pleckstrin-like domain